MSPQETNKSLTSLTNYLPGLMSSLIFENAKGGEIKQHGHLDFPYCEKTMSCKIQIGNLFYLTP